MYMYSTCTCIYYMYTVCIYICIQMYVHVVIIYTYFNSNILCVVWNIIVVIPIINVLVACSLVSRPLRGRGKVAWYLMFVHAPKLPRKLVIVYSP